MNVCVSTKEQLLIAKDLGARRIYVALPTALSITDTQPGSVELTDAERYLALPCITREASAVDLKDLQWVVEESATYGYTGVLARNLEQIGFLKERGYTGKIVTDASLYVWNNGALSFLKEVTGEALEGITLPYELSYQELADIREAAPRTMVVYGRIPMMVSANCVQKTTDHCFKQDVSRETDHGYTDEVVLLTDRLQHTFPVVCNCRYCYNVILNTIPLSLHKQLPLMVRDHMAERFRVDLTTERGDEAKEILRYWKRLIRKVGFDKAKTKVPSAPYEAYTTGNYRRSAE